MGTRLAKVFFIFREVRGEITDLVVNTWAVELENMLYKVPGKLRGIKERPQLDGLEKHPGSGVK